MPNHCVVVGCNSGYKTCIENKAKFCFPIKNDELVKKWVKFVNRKHEDGSIWSPGKYDTICEDHFEKIYIKCGKRKTLDYKLFPIIIPTIQSEQIRKRPSTAATSESYRKPPKTRNFQEDELQNFESRDKISTFDDITEKNCPPGFEFNETDDFKKNFNLEFNSEDGFPRIFESIRIDKDLHVKLQYNGNPLPLPSWFVQGTNARLKQFSSLENFPSYMRGFKENDEYGLIDELNERRHYKPKGRPPYSAKLIRYALLLRYSSLQAYKKLLEQFPLPSISLLNKIQRGGVDAIKAAKHLLEKGEISEDIILMFDEMYLQKEDQYSGGEYIGSDEGGNFYKGVVAFMIVGLKKSVAYVIKACPETSIKGEWLAEEISKSIEILCSSGFNVRGVVCDNHSANVSAYKILLNQFQTDDSLLFINYPKNKNKTYIFFDNVHLLKNIRNNLFNSKKFVFDKFDSSSIPSEEFKFPQGYISWSELHRVYDLDCKLPANLRKAYKLSFKSLHPGDNKQSVKLALAIFDETTIAAIRSYFPERKDMSGFLGLILKWWTIINSNSRFNSNKLAHAFILNDGKPEFLRNFASWIELWCSSPSFCLTKQTSAALIRTLKAQASLIDELLAENYSFVIPRKLQSDPLERRFSQYRQMSGGRFLVSLREVKNSEKILACRSLLKEGVDFWKEDLQPNFDQSILKNFQTFIEEHESYISEISLSEGSLEVATTVAGFVGKQLSEKSSCDECKSALISNDSSHLKENSYFKLLSRGYLTVPSPNLADFVSNAFAILDYFEEYIPKFQGVKAKSAGKLVLDRYALAVQFTCSSESCMKWGMKLSTGIIVNIFYNNKRKISTDSIRKSQIVRFKRRQRSKSE